MNIAIIFAWWSLWQVDVGDKVCCGSWKLRHSFVDTCTLLWVVVFCIFRHIVHFYLLHYCQKGCGGQNFLSANQFLGLFCCTTPWKNFFVSISLLFTLLENKSSEIIFKISEINEQILRLCTFMSTKFKLFRIENKQLCIIFLTDLMKFIHLFVFLNEYKDK